MLTNAAVPACTSGWLGAMAAAFLSARSTSSGFCLRAYTCTASRCVSSLSEHSQQRHRHHQGQTRCKHQSDRVHSAKRTRSEHEADKQHGRPPSKPMITSREELQILEELGGLRERVHALRECVNEQGANSVTQRDETSAATCSDRTQTNSRWQAARHQGPPPDNQRSQNGGIEQSFRQ